jgi:hypothetical protein
MAWGDPLPLELPCVEKAPHEPLEDDEEWVELLKRLPPLTPPPRASVDSGAKNAPATTTTTRTRINRPVDQLDRMHRPPTRRHRSEPFRGPASSQGAGSGRPCSSDSQQQFRRLRDVARLVCSASTLIANHAARSSGPPPAWSAQPRAARAGRPAPEPGAAGSPRPGSRRAPGAAGRSGRRYSGHHSDGGRPALCDVGVHGYRQQDRRNRHRLRSGAPTAPCSGRSGASRVRNRLELVRIRRRRRQATPGPLDLCEHPCYFELVGRPRGREARRQDQAG